MPDTPRPLAPGQRAYEAYNRAFSGQGTMPWEHASPRTQATWAAIEREVLDLDTLPAGQHEEDAARYLAHVHPGGPGENAAMAAVAHAVLGLCDLLRTLIANA